MDRLVFGQTLRSAAPGQDDSVRHEWNGVRQEVSQRKERRPLFLSEQANAHYDVLNHASIADDVGYRVEVTGVVDEKAKTIFRAVGEATVRGQTALFLSRGRVFGSANRFPGCLDRASASD